MSGDRQTYPDAAIIFLGQLVESLKNGEIVFTGDINDRQMDHFFGIGGMVKFSYRFVNLHNWRNRNGMG